jgi:hypothetical protein
VELGFSFSCRPDAQQVFGREKTTEKVSKRVKYWPYAVSIDGTDSKITAKTLLKTIKVSNQEKTQAAFLSLWL